MPSGGKRAKDVDLQEFVKQQDKLNTGFMTLGKWLSSYPPLCQRLAAIDSDLPKPTTTTSPGCLRACLIIAILFISPLILGYIAFTQFGLGDFFAGFDADSQSSWEFDYDEYEDYDDDSIGDDEYLDEHEIPSYGEAADEIEPSVLDEPLIVPSDEVKESNSS